MFVEPLTVFFPTEGPGWVTDPLVWVLLFSMAELIEKHTRMQYTILILGINNAGLYSANGSWAIYISTFSTCTEMLLLCFWLEIQNIIFC
jgi:hypothetical protein